MKDKITNNIVLIFSLIFIIFSILFVFPTKEVYALEKDQSAFIKKVSQSYTNKFCNSIAFGLSKESAMNFSMKENNEVFKKRKEISDINKELLAEEVALSVNDKCGYLINLYGEKDIQDFKSYYLSKDIELSKQQ